MSDPKATSMERKARSKVLAKKGFYIHFGIFAIVSLFFLTINLLTDPSSLWFYYPVVSGGRGSNSISGHLWRAWH
ncbi:MAG: 2TM domain-containing protein [Saprospiraceae bacterium]|nr:2TM domain-containing protein [Saprospiraceae bacterium]